MELMERHMNILNKRNKTLFASIYAVLAYLKKLLHWW